MVFMARLYGDGFKPAVIMLDQTNVAIARNQLSHHFLEAHKMEGVGPFEVAMWIDSDQTFTYQNFLNLLDHYDQLKNSETKVEILSGRYITRDLISPKVCAFNRYEENKHKAILPESQGIVEVDGFGFGFVLMSPNIMQKMYDEYGLHQFCFQETGRKEEGGIIGEDLDWCIKAQKIGIKLYFDNDVSIGHYGGVIDDKVFRMVK